MLSGTACINDITKEVRKTKGLSEMGLAGVNCTRQQCHIVVSCLTPGLPYPVSRDSCLTVSVVQ